MTAIYTRPAYYDPSWKGIRKGLDVAKLSEGSTEVPDKISLADLQGMIPKAWDDNIRSFLPFWMDNLDATIEEVFALYSHELSARDENTGEFYFGSDSEENPGKFTPQFRLTAHQGGTLEDISLEEGLDGMLPGSTILMTVPSTENTWADKPSIAKEGAAHFNIVNFYYTQKALELLAIDLGKILLRGKHIKKGEVGAFDLIQSLKEISSSTEATKAAVSRAAARTIFPRNYQHVRDIFCQLLQIRMIIVLNICSPAEDPQDALDWIASCDGPLFCGPDAAELSTIADQVFPDSYPNFFRLRGEEGE